MPKKQIKIKDWKPAEKMSEMNFPNEPNMNNLSGFIGREDRKRFEIGKGKNSIKMDFRDGFYIGADNFADASLSISMSGSIIAKRMTMDNFISCLDSSVVYTGTWTTETVATLVATKRKISSTVGDDFTITFSGTSIGLFFERFPGSGKLKIYIDGVLQTTFDLYTTVLMSRSVVWKITTLTNSVHTLKGEVETKNVSATGNSVNFEGYSLFPNDGIKLESLSCDLYTYAGSFTTDAQGYCACAIAFPTGYVVYHIVGISPTVQRMSKTLGDATSRWDVTNPVGTTMRYTYDGTGTAPSFASLIIGTTSLVISGFNAGNNGTFTVNGVGVTYFEITNVAGVVESDITGATMINANGNTVKVVWRNTDFWIYDGQPSSSHGFQISLLISKL